MNMQQSTTLKHEIGLELNWRNNGICCAQNALTFSVHMVIQIEKRGPGKELQERQKDRS